MGVVNAVVDTVSSAVSNVVGGVGDILSGDIGAGLSKLGPTIAAVGLDVATGGATVGTADAGLMGLESLAASGVDVGALSSAAPAISGEVGAAASGLGAAGSLASTAAGLAPVTDLSTAAQVTQAGNVVPATSTAAGATAVDAATKAATGGTTLDQILKGASGASQIIGGIGKLQQQQQLKGQADPFAQYRAGYAQQLSNLLQDPNTITQTPGYQFNLAQGLQAMQAQQAAQGRLVSGGGLIQAQQFGQQLAGQTYQQQLANLAALSGATQSPATGTQAAIKALDATSGGWQSIIKGAGDVANPLATLYANYNTGTPSA